MCTYINLIKETNGDRRSSLNDLEIVGKPTTNVETFEHEQRMTLGTIAYIYDNNVKWVGNSHQIRTDQCFLFVNKVTPSREAMAAQRPVSTGH